MTTQTIDEAKLGAFMEHVLGDAAGLMSCVLSTLGDRLGLFRALADGPATSAELSSTAEVNERYAREWLRGMHAAGYLELDRETGRYVLPLEHAQVVAAEGGPAFLAGAFQMTFGYLRTIDRLTEAFRSGGGVPQSAYPADTWEGMSRFSRGFYDNLLVQRWLPAAGGLEQRLAEGASWADVGCGAGTAVIRLAEAFPAATFVGYDNFEGQLRLARRAAAEAGVSDRVRFELLDAATGLPERYDVISTFDVVHDAVDPLALVSAIRRGLKPGGAYLMLEMNCADDPDQNSRPARSAAVRSQHRVLHDDFARPRRGGARHVRTAAGSCPGAVRAGGLRRRGARRPSGRVPLAVRGEAMSNPLDLSAVEQAQLVRDGELTARELVSSSVERIGRLDPILNAFVATCPELALAEAEAIAPGDPRPLCGVPIAVKDLLSATRGMPTTQGSAGFGDWVADHDSAHVRRLRAAGAIIVGKTNTPELGLRPVTENRRYGATRNPWNTTLSSGGSSGGSAAAAASGMVPLAEGSDLGGSIRIPASCCGLVGLKPSRGRVSIGPDLGLIGLGAAADGVLTRTVLDTATALDAIAGYEPGDHHFLPAPERPFTVAAQQPQARTRVIVSLTAPLGVRIDPEPLTAARHAADALAGLGHDVCEGTPAWDDDAFPSSWAAFTTGTVQHLVRVIERLHGFAVDAGASGTDDARVGGGLHAGDPDRLPRSGGTTVGVREIIAPLVACGLRPADPDSDPAPRAGRHARVGGRRHRRRRALQRAGPDLERHRSARDHRADTRDGRRDPRRDPAGRAARPG